MLHLPGKEGLLGAPPPFFPDCNMIQMLQMLQMSVIA